MNIGIDGNEANVVNKVGSNAYAYELINRLYYLTADRKDLNFNIYLKQSPRTIFPEVRKNWHYHIFGPKKMWTQWRLPLELYKKRFSNKKLDVFFTPGHYAPRFSPFSSVISIMDLAFLNFPDEFRKRDLKQLKAWTKYSVQNAKHIFAISQATKRDIIKHYKISEEKISVTYLGFKAKEDCYQRKTDRSFANFKAHLGVTNPYLLYVGTLQPRKNIVRLIDAFNLLLKSGNNSKLKLVIVGKKGWLYKDIFEKVKKLDLYDRVIFTGFVSDWEKYELLRYAKVFILPSLYEGFGIPVLEAMSVGVPVVISKNSSLPEVGGDLAYYIDDPYSVESIYKSILPALDLNKNQRLDLMAKSKQWVKKFSWQQCAKQTLDKLINV